MKTIFIWMVLSVMMLLSVSIGAQKLMSDKERRALWAYHKQRKAAAAAVAAWNEFPMERFREYTMYTFVEHYKQIEYGFRSHTVCLIPFLIAPPYIYGVGNISYLAHTDPYIESKIRSFVWVFKDGSKGRMYLVFDDSPYRKVKAKFQRFSETSFDLVFKEYDKYDGAYMRLMGSHRISPNSICDKDKERALSITRLNTK